MNVIFAADKFGQQRRRDRCKWCLEDHPASDLLSVILATAAGKYPAVHAAISTYPDEDCIYVEIYYSAEKLRRMGYRDHPKDGHVDVDGYHHQLRFVPDEMTGDAA